MNRWRTSRSGRRGCPSPWTSWGKRPKSGKKCNPPQLEDLARNLELRAELSEQLRLRVDADHLRKRARHILAAAEDQAAASEAQTT